MTQNSILNPMPLSSVVKNSEQKSTSKTATKGDDSFVDILNDKIHAASESNRRSGSQVHKKESFSEEEYNAVAQKASANETEENHAAAQKASANETEENHEAGSVKGEEALEDTALLESIIAMLQDLMTKLDLVAAHQDSLTSDAEQELMLGQLSKGISASEFLKSTLGSDAKELNALLEKMDSNLASQFKELIQNLRTVADGAEESQVDSSNSFNLSFKIEKAEGSGEQLLSQLKAQCSGMAEKLNKQMSELNQSLSQQNEGQELAVKSLADSANAEGSDQTHVYLAQPEPKVEDIREKPHKADQNHEPTNEMVVTEGNTEASPFYPVSAAGVQQESVVAEPEATASQSFPENPLTQNVSDQVIVKVKLMAGENKQEMEMHLKPESLGKLSLKIIHDRGEIVAKITAENEQVKGILESNMGLLKDALEKSGLSVQSLSVSVGNGEEKNRYKQNHDENDTTSSGESVKTNLVSVSDENLYDRSQAIRDYYDRSSQINLKA